MIRFSINRDKKIIELLSGGSVEELQDLINKFKDYSFILAKKEVENKGVLVGGVYKTVISGIERN